MNDAAARIDPREPSQSDVELRPWSLRTLAFELEATRDPRPIGRRAVGLRGTLQGFSRDGEGAPGGFDGVGRSFPLELTPLLLQHGPVAFDLAAVHGGGGVRAGDGGAVEIPHGYAEIWWLGASTSEQTLDAHFLLEGKRLDARFPSWRRPLAAPDRRLLGGLLGFRTGRGWSRRESLVWAATHLHDRRGRNLAAERGMLFAASLRLGGAGGELRLPQLPGLRLVAATLVREPARPVAETIPLFEVFD